MNNVACVSQGIILGPYVTNYIIYLRNLLKGKSFTDGDQMGEEASSHFVQNPGKKGAWHESLIIKDLCDIRYS